MKLSPYCKKVANTSAPSLFNMLTREEITVTSELCDALEKREFDSFPCELEKELTDSSILVPDDFDAESNLLSLWNEETSVGDRLDITYALTYRCNMRCGYCIQSGVNGESECGSGEFLKWATHLLEMRKPKNFNLTFFGGEPLLKRGDISDISSSLHQLCANTEIDFGFSVISNGTLINAEDVKLWKSQGLESLDITIDGIRENHDRKRIYGNGAGTFDDIIGNLKKIRGDVSVNIISNLAPESADYGDFLFLLSDLRDEIGLNAVRFKPYYEGMSGGCFFGESHVETMKKIEAEARALSLPVESGCILGPCGFFDNNTFAVSPSGDIYPCTPFFGDRRYSLRTIKGAFELDKKHSLKDNLSEECLVCTYCPVCFGGCRYISLKAKGNVSSPTCEKRFFEGYFRDM